MNIKNLKVYFLLVLAVFVVSLSTMNASATTESKADIVTNNSQVEEQKGAKNASRAINSFDLKASVSKTEFANYTETATINFTVKHNDSTSSLVNGKLEIDFGLMDDAFEVISYPSSVVGNSNITSASYNKTTGILTVNLKNPISTGTQFDYSVVVSAGAFSKDGDVLKAKATLSGKNSSNAAYDNEEATATIDVNGVGVPTNIDYTKPEWRYNAGEGISTSNVVYDIQPGSYLTYGDQSTLLKNYPKSSTASFKNLKIKLEQVGANKIKELNDASISVLLSETGAPALTGVNTAVLKTSINDEKTIKTFEYGKVNGNKLGTAFIGVNNFYIVPTNATEGTVYEYKMSICDGDNLVAVRNVKINVMEVKTSIDFKLYAQQNEIEKNDYYSVALKNNVSSGGEGVRDYTTTINVPSGTKVVSFSEDRASTKKVEVLSNGTWQTVATKRLATYDFDEYPNITKVRYTMVDIKNSSTASEWANDASIRFQNISNPVGSNIVTTVDSLTYTDFDNIEKTYNVSNEKAEIKVKDSLEKAEVRGYTQVLEGASNPFAIPHFNGDEFKQILKLNNYANKLNNPYMFVVLPKGMSMNDAASAYVGILYSNGERNLDSSVRLLGLNYPKSNNDIEYKSYELSDDRVLHFWYLDDSYLQGVLNNTGVSNRTQSLTKVHSYKLNTVKSGEYDIIYGAGSLTDDTYNVKAASAAYEGAMNLEPIPAEIKAATGNIETNNAFITTKKLTVAINNSITTEMEIKGSQDSNYIDASSGTGESIPGKEVAYRVSLTNAGTNELSNFEAVEILPYVGDKLSTKPSQSRGSQFNVNLGSNVKVIVDGEVSNDVYVMYSTSNDPIRLDSDGNSIGTGTWSNTPPTDMSTVKSIKAVMPSKPFKIGSTIQLEFTGTLPLDAPRNGEIAYNTVALSAETQTLSGKAMFVSEPAKGGVKSTAPATDLELSGKIYMDFNKNGNHDANELGYNGVTLNLYKKNGASWDKVDSLTSAPDSSSNQGIFGFTGMDNGTYKIEAIKPDNAEFVSAGNNSFELNGTNKAWLKYNGSVELSIDDLTGVNPKKITNLAGPFYVETEFKGTIKFVDKNGDVVTSNTYGKGFDIQLQDASGTDISGASTTSLADGSFKISSLVMAKANFKLAFTKTKGGFIYPSTPNDSNLNVSTGVYSFSDVEAGKGAIADIYISDNDNPSMSITKDKAINPTNISLNATDPTTSTTIEYVIKLNGIQVGSGSTSTVSVPSVDGAYTIEAKAIDAALNESSVTTDSFTIDKTKPVITISKDNHTVKVGSSAIGNSELMSIFGVSATDVIDSSVNASKVEISGSVNVNKAGEYPITFKVSDAAGNEQTKVVKVVVEQLTINGIVYEDANYNSTKDDSGVLSGVEVKLVNSDTDVKISSTTTDSNGKYEFKISETGSVSKYAIKAEAKSGYVLANKGADSILDLSTMKSDTMTISGSDYLNKHIGMAKDVAITINPNTQKVYVGDTVTSNVNLSNGTLKSSVIANNKVSMATLTNTIDITGVSAGSDKITLVFENGYKRASENITREITINVLALPTAQGNDVVLAKNEEKVAGITFTPSDGIVTYTSSVSSKVNIDATGKLKGLDKGVSVVKGKVTTNDSQAKVAEKNIVVAVGSNVVIKDAKTRATITHEIIDAENFALTYDEALAMTDMMLKTKSAVWAQTVDSDWNIDDVTLDDIVVESTAIDLTQVPDDGAKAFDVKFTAPHLGASVTIKVMIAGKNTVINPTNDEGISAQGFNIKVSDVNSLTDSKVLKLSKAKAWNLTDASTVAITKVDYSKVKAKEGTYKVTLSTDKETSITVDAKVQSDEDVTSPPTPPTPPTPLPDGGSNELVVAIILLVSALFIGSVCILTKRKIY